MLKKNSEEKYTLTRNNSLYYQATIFLMKNGFKWNGEPYKEKSHSIYYCFSGGLPSLGGRR